jgi:hypothetical protein
VFCLGLDNTFFLFGQKVFSILWENRRSFMLFEAILSDLKRFKQIKKLVLLRQKLLKITMHNSALFLLDFLCSPYFRRAVEYN